MPGIGDPRLVAMSIPDGVTVSKRQTVTVITMRLRPG
jgi:hypothetical protein